MSKALAMANRGRMPTTARIVDEFRALFGHGVRVCWAVEDGVELGRRSDPGRTMYADQWLAYLKTGERPC